MQSRTVTTQQDTKELSSARIGNFTAAMSQLASSAEKTWRSFMSPNLPVTQFLVV